MLANTKKSDPFLYDHLVSELHRQEENIEMIASESIVPPEIMELQGSVITNTTLVGYPNNRSQVGSKISDEIELEAIRRAKELFGCGHANMQVYSGSTANYGVYASVLKPGDTVLSMSPDQGGHTTHGIEGNLSYDVYNFVYYGVDPKTELIDMEEVRKKALEYKPKLILAGATFYPRAIDYKGFSEIAKEIGAFFMVDMAHICGLVAAGVMESPVPYADFVATSTTKTFCGPRSGMILCKAEHAKRLDDGVFPGLVASVHMNEIAAKCFALKNASTPKFKKTMQQIIDNAKALADALSNRGFRIVSGQTDNHLLLVDVRSKGITGKQFQTGLHKAGITVNNILVPYDTNPTETSGVRIGLTCVTQRNMACEEMIQIADIMSEVADNVENEEILSSCKVKSQTLISQFPLYSEPIFGEQYE